MGNKPASTTNLSYYEVINQPITDLCAIQECIKRSDRASKELGQQYTIITYYLGVCMKAYPLLWQYPQFYKDHIVLMGSFHTVCAYLRVIGKKVTGSGFEDILSEAALITTEP